MQHAKLYLQYALLLGLFLCVAGCTVSEGTKTSLKRGEPGAMSPRLSSQSEIVWEQWVRKATVQIYLQPAEAPVTLPTALFYPFMPKIDLPQGRHVSRELSRMIWQTWLSERVFSVLEFADYATLYTPERAIALARQRGADLAIGGYVTNYMAGGSVGDTYVALHLDIYDTLSGELIWSMDHAGMMQSEFTRDYILFSSRTRLPSDPTWGIMQALSQDMAKPLLAWTSELREEEGAAAEAEGSAAF